MMIRIMMNMMKLIFGGRDLVEMKDENEGGVVDNTL